MSDFLEMLRLRLGDAQRRVQESQILLQQAQAKHQAVAQEYTSLQTLINIEIAKTQGSPQQAGQPTAVQPQPTIRVMIPQRPVTAQAPLPTAQRATLPGGTVSPEVNKTQIIREVLRRNTNGITPAQVWLNVKDQIERNYVYSVLKRMKDKDEVKERRGKYYLQVHSGKDDGGNGERLN